MASSTNSNHTHSHSKGRGHSFQADLEDNWRTNRAREGGVGQGEPEADREDPSPNVRMTDKFREGVDLGHFWTSNDTPNKDEEIDFSRPPAKVLPLAQLRVFTRRRMDLSGASGVIRFTDGDRALYRKAAQARLYAWLKQNKGIFQGEEKPHFVSISKRIRRILITPLLPHRGWGFFAVRIHDVIFLRNYQDKSGSVGRMKKKPANVSALVFKRIAIGQDPQSHEFNEFEEPVTIRKVTVGTPSHSLLILCCGICSDENGKNVIVRSDSDWWSGKTFKKERYMEIWATAVLGGLDSLIMGHRNKDNRLTSVERLSVNDVWKRCEIEDLTVDQEGLSLKDRCFNFLQNVLDQVREELPSSDPGIVKKFEWEPDPDNLEGGSLKCAELVDAELREAKKKVQPDRLDKNVFQSDN